MNENTRELLPQLATIIISHFLSLSEWKIKRPQLSEVFMWSSAALTQLLDWMMLVSSNCLGDKGKGPWGQHPVHLIDQQARKGVSPNTGIRECYFGRRLWDQVLPSAAAITPVKCRQGWTWCQPAQISIQQIGFWWWDPSHILWRSPGTVFLWPELPQQWCLHRPQS